MFVRFICSFVMYVQVYKVVDFFVSTILIPRIIHMYILFLFCDKNYILNRHMYVFKKLKNII